MSKKVRNEVTVGLTVMVSLILAIIIVVKLADWSNLFVAERNVTVQQPYQVGLKGLMAGSPIFLGGAKIGTVSDTYIENKPGADGELPEIYVYFTMTMPQEYQLRDDCVLSAYSNVLGGQSSLVIKDIGSEGAVIPDGAVLELAFEPSITEAIENFKQVLDPENPKGLVYQLSGQNTDSLMYRLLDIAANLQQLSGNINAQTELTQDKKTLMVKVHSILDRFDNVVGSLNREMTADTNTSALAKVHAALDKLNTDLAEIQDVIVTNKPIINEAVVSVRNTAGTLEEEMAEILEQVKNILKKADDGVEIAQEAIAKIKALAQEGYDTIRLNRDTISSTVRNFHEISANLKLVSREIRRAPWRLLYKPGEDEQYIQGVIDSAGAFAAGAEQLDAVSLRLKAVLEASGETITLDKERIDTIVAELETAFGQFKKAEDKLWDELK